ncbi:MAG: hypothetical protein LBG13_01275 [Holosporales bacterium]|jgi:hypothetical protein|nr:hypothetical protein [Holosporales bacterium]
MNKGIKFATSLLIAAGCAVPALARGGCDNRIRGAYLDIWIGYGSTTVKDKVAVKGTKLVGKSSVTESEKESKDLLKEKERAAAIEKGVAEVAAAVKGRMALLSLENEFAGLASQTCSVIQSTSATAAGNQETAVSNVLGLLNAFVQAVRRCEGFDVYLGGGRYIYDRLMLIVPGGNLAIAGDLDLYFEGRKILTLLARGTVLAPAAVFVAGAAMAVQKPAAAEVIERFIGMIRATAGEYKKRVLDPVMKKYADETVGLDITEINEHQEFVSKVKELVDGNKNKALDVAFARVVSKNIMGVDWMAGPAVATQFADAAAAAAGAASPSRLTTAVRDTILAVCNRLKSLGYSVLIDGVDYTTATQLGVTATPVLGGGAMYLGSVNNIDVICPRYGNNRVRVLSANGPIMIGHTLVVGQVVQPQGVDEYLNMICVVGDILRKASTLCVVDTSSNVISGLIKTIPMPETSKLEKKAPVTTTKIEDIVTLKEAFETFSQTKNDKVFIDVNLGVCSSFSMLYTALEAGASFYPSKEIVVKDVTNKGQNKNSSEYKVGIASIAYPSDVTGEFAHKLTFKEKVSGHITPVIGFTNGSFILYAACKLKYSKYELNFEPSINKDVCPSNAVVTTLSGGRDSKKEERTYTDLALDPKYTPDSKASAIQKLKKNAFHTEIGCGVDCRISRNVIVGLGYWFEPKNKLEYNTSPYVTRSVHDTWQNGAKHALEMKSHKFFLKAKFMMPF